MSLLTLILYKIKDKILKISRIYFNENLFFTYILIEFSKKITRFNFKFLFLFNTNYKIKLIESHSHRKSIY